MMIAHIFVALLGVLHGFINANAAGGTAIALPLLVLFGIPAPVANGSNRIALVVSGITRLVVFHKARVVDWRNGFKLLIPTAIGAFIGAGQPFDIKKVESVFHRIRKRAGLPHFRLYDLRHTTRAYSWRSGRLSLM